EQSKSNNSLPRNDREQNFESWFDDEVKNVEDRPSSKNSDTSVSVKPKEEEEKGSNLINFDEDKWVDDDDVGWESIDTK
ncbi:unnamed protein product, partial [Rotaria magnacalcarata]